MKDGATWLIESAKNILSTVVDAIAVLLINCCVVPVLTFFAFFWIIRYTLGLSLFNEEKYLKLFIVKKGRGNKQESCEKLNAPIVSE